jgi:hypothetical protein
LAQGILANDKGLIFMITDRHLAEHIARNQIFELDYAVIKILPAGIMGRLRREHVGELTAPWHRVATQRRIAPRFLKLIGQYRTEVPLPSEGEMQAWESMGGSREQCIENSRRFFDVCRRSRRLGGHT